MASYENEYRSAPVSPDNEHAQLLYESLEQYNEEQKKSRRPSVIFCALLFLFLSSAGGIALAVALMAKGVEIGTASLSRDIILFAGAMSLLYICLHIRGARKEYKKERPGPPQSHGNYLHASAVLVARLSIITWVAALIATAVIIARNTHFEGFSGKVPFLNLLICIGAMPAFLIISVTIEKNPTPFATTAVSTPSFLTYRVSEFADDLATDLSVSRRSSLLQKQSRTNSTLTLPTQVFWSNGYKGNEKDGDQPDGVAAGDNPDGNISSPMSEKQPTLPELRSVSPLALSPTKVSTSGSSTQAIPQPAYFPGGWRAEWNSAAEQDASMSGGLEVPTTRPPLTHRPESQYTMTQTTIPPPTAAAVTAALPVATSVPTPPTSRKQQQQQQQQQQKKKKRHPAKASTSIASSAARSNLSTVRYAAQPEIAVRQPIRVVRNPAYMEPQPSSSSTLPQSKSPSSSSTPLPLPATAVTSGGTADVGKPDPVALLRTAQRAQRTVSSATASSSTYSGDVGMGVGAGVSHGPKRTPSNFSRPMGRR